MLLTDAFKFLLAVKFRKIFAFKFRKNVFNFLSHVEGLITLRLLNQYQSVLTES